MINAATASILAITLIIAGNLIRMMPPVRGSMRNKRYNLNVNIEGGHIGNIPTDSDHIICQYDHQIT
jgi:hypothetical protein